LGDKKKKFIMRFFEIQDMLRDLPPESLEIKKEAPFMQSIFIR